MYSNDLENETDTYLYNTIQKFLGMGSVVEALPYVVELVKRLETEKRNPASRENLDRLYFFGGSGLMQRYIGSGKRTDLVKAQNYFEKHFKNFPNSQKAHLSLKNLGNLFIEQGKRVLSNQSFIRLYQNPELRERLSPEEKSLILDNIIQNFYVLKDWNKGKPWFQKGLKSRNIEYQSRAAIALFASELSASDDLNIKKAQQLIPYISINSASRHDVGFNYSLMKSARQLATNQKIAEASVLYNMVLTTEDMAAFYSNRKIRYQKQLDNLKQHRFLDNQRKKVLQQKFRFEISTANRQLDRFKDPQSKGYIASYSDDLEWLKGQNYALSGRNYEAFWAFDKLIHQSPDYQRYEEVLYAAFSQALEIALDQKVETIGEAYLSQKSFTQYRRVLATQMAQYYLSYQKWEKFYTIAPQIILEDCNDDYAVQVIAMLGQSYLQNADIMGMRTQFKALWDQNKQTKITPDCIYWYALSYLFTEAFEEAKLLFKKVIDGFPESNYYPDSQFRLAACYYSLDDFEGADRLLVKFVKDYPNSPLIPEAETFLGDIDAYWAQVDNSLAHYRNVEKSVQLQENPSQISFVAHATIQGAALLEENQRIDEALVLFKDFLVKYPDSKPIPQIIYKLGLIYEKMGRPDQMLNSWAESITLYGDDPNATGIDQIAETFTEKYQETSKIIAINKQLLLELSKSKEMRQRIIAEGAYRYEVFNQPYIDESLKQQITRDINFRAKFVEGPHVLEPYLSKYQKIQEGFRIEPPSVIFKKALGKAFEENKRTMILRLQMMLDAMGELQGFDYFSFTEEDHLAASPASLIWMGKKLQSLGMTDEAVKIFQHLLEYFGDSQFVANALLNLGTLERSNQNFGKSIAYFSRIEAEFFDEETAAVALINKAEILIDQKNYNQARQSLKKILQNRQWRGEIHAKAFFYMGETHYQETNYKDALSFYERAYFGFKKFPQLAIQSCRRASEILITLENSEKARQYIEEFLEDKSFSDYFANNKNKEFARDYEQLKSLLTKL